MTSIAAPGLQDALLAHLRDYEVPVIVFLVTGIRLQGHVRQFDRFGIALMRDNQTQFVFKHAISAINPLADIPQYSKV